jgi:HTH-type transcriptional regulator / antitoxin HigA
MKGVDKVSAKYISLIKRFPLAPIKDEDTCDEAVEMMQELTDRFEALTVDERNYLCVLGDLISAYEQKHALPPAKDMGAAEALRYLMEINGLRQADLVSIVGYKSHLSAFLSGKRGLSVDNAIKLAERFKVDPMLFLARASSARIA